MSERKYYVICDDDCRFPGMTSEQILTAIQQAVADGYVSDPDAAVISKIKEINKGGEAQVWVGTEAEYNAINPGAISGIVRIGSDGKMYFCTDDSTLEAYRESIINDLREEFGSLDGYELIGTWTHGGALERDFAAYNELLFVYDKDGDNTDGVATLHLPTDFLNNDPDVYKYFGAMYSEFIYFKIKINISGVTTYAATTDGGASNTSYKIYCYGR